MLKTPPTRLLQFGSLIEQLWDWSFSEVLVQILGYTFFHLSFAAPGMIIIFYFFFFCFCVVAHSSVRLALHCFWPETFAFLFCSTLCCLSSFARLCPAAALIASTVQKERLLRLYALCTYKAPPHLSKSCAHPGGWPGQTALISLWLDINIVDKKNKKTKQLTNIQGLFLQIDSFVFFFLL